MGVCIAGVDAQKRTGPDTQAGLLQGLTNCRLDGLSELHGAAGQAPGGPPSSPRLLQQQPPRTVEDGTTGARHDQGVMADLPAQGSHIAHRLAPHGTRPEDGVADHSANRAVTRCLPSETPRKTRPLAPAQPPLEGDARKPGGIRHSGIDIPRRGSRPGCPQRSRMSTTGARSTGTVEPDQPVTMGRRR